MAHSRSRARRTAGSTRGHNGPKASTGPQAAQETLQGRVGGVLEQAQETWANLEALFQSRVERAMHRLGVPTAAEIRELSRRVAELNDTVIESRKPRRATKSAPRRAKAKRSRPAG
jgi:poly(hydroxyalkanoate) granule-associated protein